MVIKIISKLLKIFFQILVERLPKFPNALGPLPKIAKKILVYNYIALDKAAYCVFTQFLGPEKAIKFIAKRTKTQ